MSFLNAKTPEELRSAVADHAGAQAEADQIEAECAEVRDLAPAVNDFLRDELAVVVHRALVSMDESHDCSGTAPVLTVQPYGYAPVSAEHTRHGSEVSRSTDVVRPCHSCGDATGLVTHFWLGLGRHILQVELCNRCAVDAIDRGARPQGVTIPDAVPDGLA
ncbi:hypothetical protein Mlaev_00641 [Microbacterium laevaniformans]|uniref:Uncharacterized protein n=1 Tax=Microbacterium laevaniformans TaxID=36807 RepID=A0A150HGY5_9MICO|nr:hypothetical protein [Microbacterium laevaniformans]KXZ61382.1 hypothetical protein Mlaev_00641 [Microbacterium laevaniformans]